MNELEDLEKRLEERTHYQFSHINVRLKQLQDYYHGIDKKVDVQANDILHIRDQLKSIIETLTELTTVHLESMGVHKAKKKILNIFYTLFGLLGALGIGDLVMKVIEHHWST